MRVIPKDTRSEGPLLKVQEELSSKVADLVSGMLVEQLHPTIVNKVSQLQEQLQDKAKIYAHGGYALYATAKSEKLRAACVPDDFHKIPRDIDLSVVPVSRPCKCETAAACAKNSVIAAVRAMLRDLRREVHNSLRSSGGSLQDPMRMLQQALRSDGVARVFLANSAHVTVAPAGKRNAVIMSYMAAPRLECDAGSMPELVDGQAADPKTGCFPLRDSMNTTIAWKAVIGEATPHQVDFVLCRLALVMGVEMEDGKKRYIPVNFLDVSVPRAADDMYDHAQGSLRAPVEVSRTADLLPYPSLSYVLGTALRQLVTHKDEVERWKRQSPSEKREFNVKYNEERIVKLNKRIAGIVRCQLCMTRGAVDEATPIPARLGSACRELLGQAWWTEDQAAVLLQECVEILLKDYSTSKTAYEALFSTGRMARSVPSVGVMVGSAKRKH